MNGLLQSTMFLAPLEVYAYYLQYSDITIEHCENYQKRSYRNRAYLSGPNGLSLLSIPLLKGKNRGTPIEEVRIAYHENWEGNMLHTIRTCLGSAPYFDYYYDELAELIKSKTSHLLELNQRLLEYVLKHIGVSLQVHQSTTYEKESKLADLRAYKGGPTESSLNLYPQVFEEKHGYIHNLSILDLLFCMGPESRSILSQITLPLKFS